MFYNALPALILSAGVFHGGMYFGEGARNFPPPSEYARPPAEFARPPGPYALRPRVAPGCLSPGDARAALLSGQVVALSSVLGQIEASVGGQIVSTPLLCDMGGHLVYFVDVLTGGSITHLQVDARTGAISQ